MVWGRLGAQYPTPRMFHRIENQQNDLGSCNCVPNQSDSELGTRSAGPAGDDVILLAPEPALPAGTLAEQNSRDAAINAADELE